MNAIKSVPVIAALALVGVLAACSSAPSSSPAASPPTPSPTGSPAAMPSTGPSPTAAAATQVASPAQAAALVFAAHPEFGAIAPLQPDLIGQSAWYEASETGNGYSVLVTIGSGDCMAGCIDRRTWTYSVARDATLEQVAEEGDEVEMPGGNGGSGPATIELRLIAGPVCPVEHNPPDPNCAARPVANAEAVLRDPSGLEVARGVSDADGRIVFTAPAGAYYVEPQAVDGLMGQAAPAALSALPGPSNSLVLAYDTGIR